ncbi:MAG: hypothetical protein H6835_11805 [Planctomycetes bacterium]|nr:hypothetical protein [Planctomycetota bacterium]
MKPLASSLPLLLAFSLTSCGSSSAGDAATGKGPGNESKSTTQSPAAQTLPLAANATQWIEHVRKLVDEAEARGAATIPGVADDVLLVKELHSLTTGPFWGEGAQTASRAPKPERRDPLAPIVAYHRALQAAGIAWVFVPVPAKVAVDPSLVPGAPALDGRVDLQDVAFYEQLRQQGVPVLDVLPALRALVARGERAHCRTDSHWTPRACEVVADLVAAQLRGEAWYTGVTPADFATTQKQLTVTGDMAAMRSEPTAPEQLPAKLVEGAKDDPSSPVLLFGDSHCLVFHSGGDMLAERAGLADHLTRALGLQVDVLGVRGSGATPSRVDAFRGKRFEGKRAAVWCLTAREFTEGQGWAEVPIAR